MTIAVLTRACYPFHGHGGLERHVYDLVRHLIARENRVVLVTPPDRISRLPGDEDGHREFSINRAVFQDPRCCRYTVPYYTFPFAGRRGTTIIDRSTAYPLFGWRAGRLVADLARRGEVDVVYGHGAAALGYADARKAGAPAPFIFNPHGLEEFGATGAGGFSWLKRAGYGPLRAAVRACARAADLVIATDRALEPSVIHHLGVCPGRVRVVPNAIDIEVCDRLATPDDGRRARARHGIADAETVLLSVGRLEANKGFEVLAQALSGSHVTAARSWRWVLVGEGPNRTSIERAIEAGGLRGRTVLTGPVSEQELHAWYEAADLFVHPTLYEGSSIVTLEAMAHRLPVIATTAGGLPDKVQPGVNGWLVEPGDADALAAAIREALARPDRLGRMGREGRTIALERFSWSHVIDQFLDLCAEASGRAAPSPPV